MSEFKHAGSGGYRAASQPRDEQIMENLKRDWSRHPELRAEHGNNFRRYLASARHNTTFC